MDTALQGHFVSNIENRYDSGSNSAAAVVVADRIGVKYSIGAQRENLQSRVFNYFLRRNQKRDFWALNGLSFTGYSGDIIGVIGSNGAGKTTLCKVIAGLLKPDNGRITVKGSVSALLSLGTGFNVNLSGIENIYLNAMIVGMTRSQVEDLIDDIIDFSGLGRFIHEPLKNYSKGMRARLAFSIAAMIKPEILIMDEALSSGDVAFSEKAGLRLREILKQSKIVIVVSHNLGFVKRFCTRALWIDRGVVRANGNPAEIVKQYRRSVPKKAPKKTIFYSEPIQKNISDQDLVIVDELGIKFKYKSKTAHPKGGQAQEFWPLENISFTVKKGEVVGIIGRNGEGKSTLCRILSGILKPDRGIVTVHGKTAALLTFGAGFNIHLTGRDNIYLNGLLLGIPKQVLNQLLDDIINFAELEEHIDQPVIRYSKGMRSRLGFSIAAMLKPDILIIDEALNAGDISFNRKASRKIQDLLKEAKAVIVVSHSMPFVTQVCTRVLWLDDGRIRHDGSSQETVSKYLAHIRKSQAKKKAM